MDSHRIDVFYGTHDNCIVVFIPHYLHFEFFPSDKRLFNQGLVIGAGLQGMFYEGWKFLFSVGNRASHATEGETGADDEGKP